MVASVTDLRKGFEGLAGLAAKVLTEDPFSGHLFLIRDRSGDLIKIISWDRKRALILLKRLERGKDVSETRKSPG
jgi:transposase